ncbi:MAG: fluoride efflux transporter CrcB [Salegentibacter sp.]
MIKNAILVFLGGGLGSIFRYLISKALNNTALSIPYGTLTANILGSLIIGFVLGTAIKYDSLNSSLYLLFGVGFCGGFTTFSTFAFENQALLRSGDYFHFGVYAFGSLLLGISAVIFGIFCSKFA